VEGQQAKATVTGYVLLSDLISLARHSKDTHCLFPEDATMAFPPDSTRNAMVPILAEHSVRAASKSHLDAALGC
jgi:hypothetical protein